MLTLRRMLLLLQLTNDREKADRLFDVILVYEGEGMDASESVDVWGDAAHQTYEFQKCYTYYNPTLVACLHSRAASC